MASQPQPHRRDRSLFFPIVLIGVGVVWLLVNFGLIQGFTLGRLLRLWPLFLIAAGLELLVGRGRAWISAVIGLLTVGAAVALLMYGQQLGLAQGSALKTESFSAPLDNATRAQVTLDLAQYAAQVGPTTAASNLVEADLAFTGAAVFDVSGSGSAQKSVRVGVTNDFSDPFAFMDDFDAQWQIGLSPAVPLDLTIDGGSGSADFQLQTLDLEALTLDAGSGQIDLALPAGAAYDATIIGGSAGIDITVLAGTQATLRFDGGSGGLTIEVPDGLAVRLEVQDSGSGGVRHPNGWETVRAGNNDEGVWQTPGFDTASLQFTIIVTDLGSGSVTVR